jgi:hypothetical protein
MGHRTNDDSGVQRLRDVKKPRGDPKTIGLAKKLATRRRPAAEEVAEEERLRREAEEAEAARLGFDNGAAAAAAAAAAAMTGTSGPRSFRGGCFDSALIARERTDIEQLHGAKDGGVMACTVPGAFVSLLGKAAEVMHRTTRVIPGDNGATHQHVPRDETEEVPRPGVDVYGKVFFATRQALEQGFSPRPPDNPKPAASVRGGGAAGRSQRRSPSGGSSRRLGSASARRGSPLMATSSRSAYGANASTRPTSSGSAASSTRRTTQQGAAASASISLAAQRRQQHAQMSPEQRRQASANAMLARQEQRDLARDGAFASVQAVPPHVVLKM